MAAGAASSGTLVGAIRVSGPFKEIRGKVVASGDAALRPAAAERRSPRHLDVPGIFCS
jgi:hypothetical protein